MITDEAGLQGFFEAAGRTPVIALDTEADSLHCYFEKLCLVQITTPDYEELLDPLAEVPLPRFFEVLSDKEIIFHGADYDLRLLSRYGKFQPARIFDTMLAARLSGEVHVGLAALVEKYFGVSLSKASQKANWAQRPLPQQMVAYALNDVRHLIPLAEILKNQLEEKKRMPWLMEWVDKTIQSAMNPREKDPEQRWRITGVSRLSPHAQAVARALWFWRDEEAKEWDRPPFHVMANSDILRIAEQAVAGHSYSTSRFSSRRLKHFEAAIGNALASNPEQWPVSPRPLRRPHNPRFARRFEELKSRRDKIARDLNLEPALIAPKTALEAAAGEEETELLMDWQRDLLGLSRKGPASTTHAT